MQDSLAPIRSNILNRPSQRLYKKRQETEQDRSSLDSSHNSSISLSANNNNDWHRLLLGRLRPGITGKYRTNRKIGNSSDLVTTLPYEDPNVILRAYQDETSILRNSKPTVQSETSQPFDTSLDSSLRRDNHFVKKLLVNRPTDHMTSLKRRVRKQQLRHAQNQTNTVEETTFQLSTSPTNDFLLMTYGPPPVMPRRYKPNRTNLVVPLPAIIANRRMAPTQTHHVKMNLYA